MKDIDFDELDKAVNSLMGGVKVKSDQPEAKTLTISTTLKEGEQPEYDKIKHAAEKIGSEAIAGPSENTEIIPEKPDDDVNIVTLPTHENNEGEPIPPTLPVTVPVNQPKPAPKVSKGRFMDVMHASSDMKTSDTANRLQSPSVAQTAATSALAIEPEASASPTASKLNTVVQTDALSSPDPKNNHQETKSDVVQQPHLPVETEEVTKAETTIVAPQAEEELKPEPSTESGAAPESEPLSSPFLPDAKVEKRPLGGAAAEQKSSSDTDFSALDHPFDNDNSADTQLNPTPANPADPELPAELHTDLLAIETNLADASVENTSATNDTHPATVVAPTESHSSVQPGQTPTDAHEATDGAIFDTTQYHTSVAHPAKKSSEWIWIVVIIVIILVCAGGGAAFYLLGSK